jgi:hypothetical protein
MSEDIRWKVGDRCQTDKDGNIRVGAVTVVETAQEDRTRYNYNYASRGREETYTATVIKSISVKWDDGEEQQALDEWAVYPEDSKMERAFRLAVDEAQNRIDEKMATARAALREAVQISEETGIPFRASVSPLSQSYVPNSLSEKFPGVDREFYSEIAGASGEEGWQHSAVC